MLLEYARGTPFLLKSHPQFRESWLRDRIADDPALLGLGPLRLVEVERRHPRAGRLDLLLQQGQRRYIVEIMLGRLDESHLVRSIEYWDAERQNSPGYEHVAVLAAEEMPPRLLRVLGLLRDTLPMVALQMTATQVGRCFSLHFTRLMEGPGRQPPLREPQPAGPAPWEQKGAAAAVASMEQCLTLLREVVPELHLDYQRHSLAVMPAPGSVPLVVFFPRRHFLRLEIQPPRVGAYWERCLASDWQALEAERLLHGVQVMLFPGDVAHKRSSLRRIFQAALREGAAGEGAGTRLPPKQPCLVLHSDRLAHSE